MSRRYRASRIKRSLIIPVITLVFIVVLAPFLSKKIKTDHKTNIEETASEEVQTDSRQIIPDIVISCVGDSITYGIGSRDVISASYQAYLKELLPEGCTIYNYGHSGATVLDNVSPHVQYKSTNEYKRSLESEPDVIIIMLGTNDSWYITEETVGEFKDGLMSLLKEYSDLNNDPKVFLCTPPKRFTDKRCIKATDELIVPLVRECAEKSGTELIDIYLLTKDNREISYDGIHPNKDGYRNIANAIYESISKYFTG